MTEPQWNRACVIHAKRGVEYRLTEGHVCTDCATGLIRTLIQIGQLVESAAAFIAPGSAKGTGGAKSFESKPPLNVDAVDPALALVRRWKADEIDTEAVDLKELRPDVTPQTVLEVTESWERLIRSERRLAPYGPVSLTRRRPEPRPVSAPDEVDERNAATAALGRIDARREAEHPIGLDQANLIGILGFLKSSVPWMTNDPTFPIEDFHEEMRDCLRTVKRWSMDQPTANGVLVLCPTLMDDDTTCSTKLRVAVLTEIEGLDDHRESVWCKGCGAVRAADQLLAASGAEDAYLPAAMLSEHLGVSIRTIQEWGQKEKVRRDGKRYRFGDVRALKVARDAKRKVGAA